MDWVYWHWLVLGLGLIVIEIFLPSFTVLWFGLGAVVVGILLWIFPALGSGLQVLVWTVTSILFAVAWFRYFKPKMIDKTVAGLSREGALGRVGQVVKASGNLLPSRKVLTKEIGWWLRNFPETH